MAARASPLAARGPLVLSVLLLTARGGVGLDTVVTSDDQINCGACKGLFDELDYRISKGAQPAAAPPRRSALTRAAAVPAYKKIDTGSQRMDSGAALRVRAAGRRLLISCSGPNGAAGHFVRRRGGGAGCAGGDWPRGRYARSETHLMEVCGAAAPPPAAR